MVKHDVDRYGRIVGIVYVGDICVNEEMVKNGLAWVYRRYCKIPVCEDWLALESEARAEKVGLWSHRSPVPPWEFRRSRKQVSTPPTFSAFRIETVDQLYENLNPSISRWLIR